MKMKTKPYHVVKEKVKSCLRRTAEEFDDTQKVYKKCVASHSSAVNEYSGGKYSLIR